MMREVSSYFAPVSKQMHLGLQHVANIKDKEKNSRDKEIMEAKIEARKVEKKASSARVLAKYNRANELRKSGRQAITVDDPVKWYIDEIICDELVEEESDEPMVKKTRKQFSRPKNWAVIAEFYGQWGKNRTMKSFA